jgi:hypothetical protein
MGFRNLLDEQNQDWVAPVAQTADTAFLSQDQWNQQTPTLLKSDDPEIGMYFNPATYSDYINSLPDAVKQAHPHEYASAKALDLTNGIFGAWTANGSNLAGGSMVPQWNQELEQIKQTDPTAYYNAKIGMLANQAGWDAGQGKTNADTNSQIQSLAQEAVKAGIPADQLSAMINNNYTGQAQGHATRLSQMDSGATLGGLPQFALTAAGLGLGVGGLIGALTPVAAGADAYMAAAGLNPGTFEGAAFAMPELAGVSAPTYTSPTDYMNQAGLDAGTFNSFTPTNPLTDYMGQAGLDTGNFEGANFQMPTDTTASDALNAANNARKAYGLANSLAKIGGSNSGATTGATGAATGGLTPQQLAKYLYSPTQTQTNSFIGQIKGNQTPFFGSNQSALSGQNVYDVSGSNLANALRKS